MPEVVQVPWFSSPSHGRPQRADGGEANRATNLRPEWTFPENKLERSSLVP